MDIKFQSTPPRGRRPILSDITGDNSTISIHSAARAETRPWGVSCAPQKDFNPLRREGGDRYWVLRCRYALTISIHSAARAETKSLKGCIAALLISIHSAARAETLIFSKSATALEISIHSAARAETIFFHKLV